MANCRETRFGRAELTDDFEASFSSTASATAKHVSATAETASKLRQMNVAGIPVLGYVYRQVSEAAGG